jgi:hypothetical protein
MESRIPNSITPLPTGNQKSAALSSEAFQLTQLLPQNHTSGAVTRFNSFGEWEKLMVAAPSALTSIAFCFVVTQLDGAANIQPSETKHVYVYTLALDKL